MTTRPNTAEAIGKLTASVEAMNARLDRDREDRQKMDHDAAVARESMRKSLDNLERGHADILGRVDRIEPVTQMVTGWRAKFTGIMMVLGFIGTIFLGGVAFFKDRILQLLAG